MRKINTIIALFVCNGAFWFRVKGYGLSVEDRNIYPPHYSVCFEESDKKIEQGKAVRIGRWSIKFLKP